MSRDQLPARRDQRPDEDTAIDAARLSAEARAFVAAGRAPETVRKYSYHWRAFGRWCERRGLQPLGVDPHQLANYVAHRALRGVEPEESAEDQNRDARLRAQKIAGVYVPRRTYAERWSRSMLQQGLAAVRAMHRLKGLPNPADSAVVEEAMRGISGTIEEKRRGKKALSLEALGQVLGAMGTDLTGLRDRAMLLVGFAGALRRGELLALEVRDLQEEADGIKISLGRHFSGQKVVPGTKTNRGAMREELVGLRRGDNPETCPVRALQSWLSAAGITEGRVFRSVHGGRKTRDGSRSPQRVGEPLTPQSVAVVLKRAIKRVGGDPTEFAGHSLRSGSVTSAYKKNKSMESLRRKGRWESYEMLKVYIQRAGLFEDDAMEGLL